MLLRLVTGRVTGITAVLVARPAADLAPAAAVTVVLSPQRREPLLLGVCVDVCTDDETDDVEERHPGGLRQELLGKSQRDGRDNPADLHDGHETGLDGCADLVECAGAGDQSHGGQVNTVLDGGDLHPVSMTAAISEQTSALTIKLLTRICRILALTLVRPWKSFWSMLMRT